MFYKKKSMFLEEMFNISVEILLTNHSKMEINQTGKNMILLSLFHSTARSAPSVSTSRACVNISRLNMFSFVAMD